MSFFWFARRQQEMLVQASEQSQDIRELTTALCGLSHAVQGMLDHLAKGLAGSDRRAFRPIVDTANEVRRSRHDIEMHAMGMVASASLPVSELRHTLSMMRMATELEQVARLVVSICRSLNTITTSVPAKPLEKIADMTLLVRGRVCQLAESYGSGNVDAALAVWRTDEAVDRAHNGLFAEIFTLISENARNISFGAPLLFCIKNLERAGDHATNIAEAIYYAFTGQRILEERPKHDTTAIVALKIAPSA